MESIRLRVRDPLTSRSWGQNSSSPPRRLQPSVSQDGHSAGEPPEPGVTLGHFAAISLLFSSALKVKISKVKRLSECLHGRHQLFMQVSSRMIQSHVPNGCARLPDRVTETQTAGTSTRFPSTIRLHNRPASVRRRLVSRQVYEKATCVWDVICSRH